MSELFRLQTAIMFLLAIVSVCGIVKESNVPILNVIEGTFLQSLFTFSEYREITFNLSCSLFVGFAVWLFDSFLPKSAKLYRHKKNLSKWLKSVGKSKYLIIRSLNEYAESIYGKGTSFENVVFLGDNDNKHALEINPKGQPKVKLSDINEALSSFSLILPEIQKCEDILNYKTNEIIDEINYWLVQAKVSIEGESHLFSHRQFLRLRTLINKIDNLLSCNQLKKYT